MSLLSSGKDWGREKYWRSCGGFNLTPGWACSRLSAMRFFSSNVMIKGLGDSWHGKSWHDTAFGDGHQYYAFVLLLQPAEVGRLQDPLQSTSDKQSWCLKEWLRMVDTSCLHYWPSCSFCESHRWCLSSQGFIVCGARSLRFLINMAMPTLQCLPMAPFLATYLQLPHPKTLSQHSNIQKSSCDFVIVPVHSIGRALPPLNAWSGLEVETENVLNWRYQRYPY